MSEPFWAVGGSFRDLLLGKPSRLEIHVPEFTPLTREDWRKDWEETLDGKERAHEVPAEIRDWVERHSLSHYAWSNQLSIYYDNLYRRSFVRIYLLGALAVFLAFELRLPE